MADIAPSTDFLSQLAARALGNEPSVAPRVPAMFEPQFGDDPFDGERIESTGDLLSAKSAGSRRTQGKVELEHGAATSLTDGLERQSVRPETAASNGSTARTEIEPTGQATISRTAPSSIRLAAIESFAISPRQAPPSSPSQVATEEGFPHELNGRPRERVSQGNEFAENLPSDDIGPRSIGLSTETGPMPPPAGQATAIAREAVTMARKSDDRGRQSWRDPGPPADPTINITIGRIEVRAAAPAKPVREPPRLSQREPPQSLADYLKGRERGR